MLEGCVFAKNKITLCLAPELQMLNLSVCVLSGCLDVNAVVKKNSCGHHHHHHSDDLINKPSDYRKQQ